MSRVDRFLFAPVDPRAAARFRIAFAAALALLFWPEGRALSASLGGVPGAAELWSGVFLTPVWWAACVAAIAAWGAGVGGRATGVGVLLLLPLAFLHGAWQSRQILLTSLPSRWCGAIRARQSGAPRRRIQAAPDPSGRSG